MSSTAEPERGEFISGSLKITSREEVTSELVEVGEET